MSALEEYKRKVDLKASKGKKDWTFPTTYAKGVPILSVDQTLSQAGWVCFWMSRDGTFEILDRGTIKPKTTSTSFMGTYHKALQIEQGLDSLVTVFPIDGLVFEMPAVGGYRVESSLMAGYACLSVAKRRGVRYRIMSCQHARAVMCGPGKSNDKSAMQKAMKPYCVGFRWNEHQRDALGNGMAHLHELKEIGEQAWTPSPE